MMTDTIFALATAHGRAGVAVIRISGAQAISGIKSICGFFPNSKTRFVTKIYDENRQVIDIALVLQFLNGKSFTGDEVVELHLHGSIAVQSAILNRLKGLQGFREAQPGEFTRRALENGNLDLAQVEGLGDLIDAETEAQRQQAMLVFGGTLTKFTQGIRSDILHALTLIEASIDFADEEVPEDVTGDVFALLNRTSKTLSDLLERSEQAEAVRNGFTVAVLGKPNAGKSTLINYIGGRQIAMTSDIPGTTRDVIELRVDLKGLMVTLLDTAGIRQSDDRLEAQGVEIALDRARNADLRIVLGDVGHELESLLKEGDLRFAAKADLTGTEGAAVSGITGAGVSDLLDAVYNALVQRVPTDVVAVRQRQRNAFSEAASELLVARSHLDMGAEKYDLVAEHLHRSIQSLDMMLGRIDVEEILGEIFSRFCVGK